MREFVICIIGQLSCLIGMNNRKRFGDAKFQRRHVAGEFKEK